MITNTEHLAPPPYRHHTKTLPVFTHFILTATLQSRYDSHFTDEDTESHSDEAS